MQNAFAENFNVRLRDELLNEMLLRSLDEARRLIVAWQHDYNHDRQRIHNLGIAIGS